MYSRECFWKISILAFFFIYFDRSPWVLSLSPHSFRLKRERREKNVQKENGENLVYIEMCTIQKKKNVANIENGIKEK